MCLVWIGFIHINIHLWWICLFFKQFGLKWQFISCPLLYLQHNMFQFAECCPFPVTPHKILWWKKKIMLRFGYLGSVLRTVDLISFNSTYWFRSQVCKLLCFRLHHQLCLRESTCTFTIWWDMGAYKCSKASQDSTINRRMLAITISCSGGSPSSLLLPVMWCP